MKKIQLGKDALILSILTLITVLTWIGFELYQALTKTEIPKVLQKQTTPLNPKLDEKVIENLKSRKTISEEELNKIVVSPPQILPSPIIMLEEEATESGEKESAVENINQ
jgi:arsenate reductase-like glutaredoxin family protein